MPGARSSASLKTRRDEIGAARISSRSRVIAVVGLLASIIGDSPVTVMVSCTVLSFMSMSMAKVWPARTRMPSRRTMAKPGSSAVTT